MFQSCNLFRSHNNMQTTECDSCKRNRFWQSILEIVSLLLEEEVYLSRLITTDKETIIFLCLRSEVYARRMLIYAAFREGECGITVRLTHSRPFSCKTPAIVFNFFEDIFFVNIFTLGKVHIE